MTEHYTTTDVLARVDQERVEFETLLAEIGEERMEVPGAAGDWTIKDVIAHLSDWKQPRLDSYASTLSGTPEPKSDWPIPYDEADGTDDKVEIVNDFLYQRSKDRSLDDVMAESRGQWDRLRTMIADMSEEQLNDPKLFPRLKGQSFAASIMDGGYFDHFHGEHESLIRDWLKEERLR